MVRGEMGVRNRRIDRNGSGAALAVVALAVTCAVVLAAVLIFALS